MVQVVDDQARNKWHVRLYSYIVSVPPRVSPRPNPRGFCSSITPLVLVVSCRNMLATRGRLCWCHTVVSAISTKVQSGMYRIRTMVKSKASSKIIPIHVKHISITQIQVIRSSNSAKQECARCSILTIILGRRGDPQAWASPPEW